MKKFIAAMVVIVSAAAVIFAKVNRQVLSFGGIGTATPRSWSSPCITTLGDQSNGGGDKVFLSVFFDQQPRSHTATGVTPGRTFLA